MAVVLFPPAEAVGAAEEFRREHDPLFHRIAAHLTVVFPFESTWERAAPRLERAVAAGATAFEVVLAGAGRFDDGVVYLRVGEGAPVLAALHERLTDAVAPPTGAVHLPFVPHLTLGRGTGPAESAFLERQAAGRLAETRFRAERLSLVVEDARGIWVERGRLALPVA